MPILPHDEKVVDIHEDIYLNILQHQIKELFKENMELKEQLYKLTHKGKKQVYEYSIPGDIDIDHLHPIAISGDYNNLTNKPTIPNTTTVKNKSLNTDITLTANDIGYITPNNVQYKSHSMILEEI